MNNGKKQSLFFYPAWAERGFTTFLLLIYGVLLTLLFKNNIID